jgi:hypothetical protein
MEGDLIDEGLLVDARRCARIRFNRVRVAVDLRGIARR